MTKEYAKAQLGSVNTMIADLNRRIKLAKDQIAQHQEKVQELMEERAELIGGLLST